MWPFRRRLGGVVSRARLVEDARRSGCRVGDDVIAAGNSMFR